MRVGGGETCAQERDEVADEVLPDGQLGSGQAQRPRDGVRRRTYEAIAETLGRTRQAVWAALKPVRLMGIAIADRARGAIRAVKQVTAADARGPEDRQEI